MTAEMIQAAKGDLTASVRELGRTRIEVVPRDARSVFVYWEVADTAPDPTTPTPIQLRIDLVCEESDVVEHSFQSSERVSSKIAAVGSDHRYYAVLNLIAPQQIRLARSSTIAGTLREQPKGFVAVEPGEPGLTTTATEAPAESPIDWTWEGTGSSPK